MSKSYSKIRHMQKSNLLLESRLLMEQVINQMVEGPFTFVRASNDEKQYYREMDISVLDNQFVKIVVEKKTDYFAFDKFIDRVSLRPIYELKIAESFIEYLGDNVEDGEIKLDDTQVLLDSYIDAVDTEADKEKLKTLLRGLYSEAQTMEIL